MLPSVRRALSDAIKARMKKELLTWFDMPKANIKTKWQCPIGWGTLRKVVNDDTYQMHWKRQIKLLDYFEILHTHKYGVVTLLNIGEHEE